MTGRCRLQMCVYTESRLRHLQLQTPDCNVGCVHASLYPIATSFAGCSSALPATVNTAACVDVPLSEADGNRFVTANTCLLSILSFALKVWRSSIAFPCLHPTCCPKSNVTDHCCRLLLLSCCSHVASIMLPTRKSALLNASHVRFLAFSFSTSLSPESETQLLSGTHAAGVQRDPSC